METHNVIQLPSSQANKGPASMPVPPSGKKPDGKKKKTWLWVLIGLVILGGLWYALTGSPSGVKAPKEENVEDTSMGTQVEGQPSFLWEFSPVAGNNETGAPRTKVTLSVGGEVREIGTYDGSCLVINGSSWTLAENELTGVICWFAGGGDEVGVFYENGAYVVKHGYLEEGVEGEAGMRGQYEELFSL